MNDDAAGTPDTGRSRAGRAVTFDELVTAATVGVSRKPLPAAALADAAAGHASVPQAADPAAALLDAAAVHTVALRAGYEPPRGITVPEAPAEAAPAFSARAARALREACGWQAGRFPADTPLLPDLLRAAAGAGYVADPPLLPALLDAAARKIMLREPVADVLGARGRWLARHRPDWRVVAEQAATPLADQDAPGDVEAWRTGMPAQRRAYLARLRDADPDAARDLLAAGWAAETANDRGQLIAILDRGLSPADEPFLEAALDDRASTVRVTARRMLARLPGSAFSQRASARAEGALRLERRGHRLGLAATPPGTPDAAALRDGLNVSPPTSSIGTGAWQLTQVIAAAPLTHWTERFGLSPAEIVTLPVTEGLDADVRAGWRLAAVNQSNAEWARALLPASGSGAGRNRPPAAWPPDHALAALVPPEEHAARLAGLLGDLNLTTVNPPGWATQGTPLLEEIREWPGPWPAILADAVLSALASVSGLPVLPSAARLLLTAAKRGLPATGERDYALRLARMAEASPHAWAPGLRAASETVLLRRIFLEEIGCA